LDFHFKSPRKKTTSETSTKPIPTIEELWSSGVFPAQKRWLDVAHSVLFPNGDYTPADTQRLKKWHKDHAAHDKVAPKPEELQKKYMPIFSKYGGAYQFDIWVQRNKDKVTYDENDPQFLIIININTKKAYQYPLEQKSADSVKQALEKFWAQVPDCKTMISDQDASFLSEEVVDAFIKHHVKLSTTTDDDHHSLGIINRLMRTIRSMRGGSKPFSAEDMERTISYYNSTTHSATGFKPDEMSKRDERSFVRGKEEQASKVEPYNFKIGDFVRYLKPKKTLGKVRSTWTMSSFKIIEQKGRSYVIQEKDGSTDTVPGFQLAHVPSIERHP
jgi:hypothetical protein